MPGKGNTQSYHEPQYNAGDTHKGPTRNVQSGMIRSNMGKGRPSKPSQLAGNGNPTPYKR